MKVVRFEGTWSDFDFRYKYEAVPKPQKTILKILYSDIIVEVFKTIDEIETAKKDPNHEGQLREITATGTFQIPGITELASDGDPAGSRVVAGDTKGNIFLLDVSRKVVSARCEAFPGKRIQGLAVSSVDYLENKVMVIAVAALGAVQVKIFLASLVETKILHYQTLLISSQPSSLTISSDAVFLAVSTVSGAVEVHRLPYLPTPNLITTDRPSARELRSPGAGGASPMNSPLGSDSARGTRVVLTSAITDTMRASDLNAKVLDVSEPSSSEAATVPEPVQDEQGNDISGLLPEFPNLPMVAFSRVEYVRRSERSYGVFPVLDTKTFTGDVVVCWKGLPQLSLYRLLEPVAENVTPELTNRAVSTKMMSDYYANTGKYTHVLPVTDPRNTWNMIAPVMCIATSPDTRILALGLSSGAVVILDLNSASISAVLSKHKGPVTSIGFVLDGELVSGGTDGAVHFYTDVADASITSMRGSLTMNLRNATSRKPIVAVKTLRHRLALALDADGHARIYDLPNSVKLGKIAARPRLGIEGWRLRCSPKSLIVLQNQQLVILSDEIPPEIAEDRFVVNRCELLVFRLPDIFLSIFPGLANANRREKSRAPEGKDPVLHLLELIPVAHRMDPTYVFEKSGDFGDKQSDKKKSSSVSRNTTFCAESGTSEADSSNVSIYTVIPGKKEEIEASDQHSDLFSPPRISILNPEHADMESKRKVYHPGKVAADLLRMCEVGRVERAERLQTQVRKVLSEFEGK